MRDVNWVDIELIIFIKDKGIEGILLCIRRTIHQAKFMMSSLLPGTDEVIIIDTARIAGLSTRK